MRTHARPLAVGLLFSNAALHTALAQTVQYAVTDLGRVSGGYTYSTTALGINNRGEVVGLGHNGTLYRAFIWSEEQGIRALPSVPGFANASSTATAINDNGDIVGFSGQDNGVDLDAWIYRNGQYTMLGTLPGMRGARPLSINNFGEVVGNATPFSLLNPGDTFYWSSASGMIDLTPGDQSAEVYDINDNGVIAGGRRSDPASGILTWNRRTGEVLDWGMLEGTLLSFGYSINNENHIAGVSTYITSGGTRTAHAVFAQQGSPLLDLNIFQSAGISINDGAEIVGSARYLTNNTYLGWVWRPGMASPQILHDVIEQPAIFSRVSDVRAINNRGQIIASSYNSSFPSPAEQSRRAVILTPIGRCVADMDNGTGTGTPDGGVTIDDLLYYLAVFADGIARADIDDGSGTGMLDGGVTIDDLLYFLIRYEAGC